MEYSIHQSRERGGIIKGLLKLVLVCLLVLGGIVAYLMFTFFDDAESHRIYTFDLLEDLSIGDRVQASGQRVGTVTGVSIVKSSGQFEVSVELEPEFAATVPANAEARIVRGGARPPYIELQGATVEASSDIDQLARDGKELAGRGVERAKEGVLSLIASARDWAEGEQGSELRSRIDDLQDDLLKMSKEGGEKAQEALERAMEKGRDLTEELKEKGRDDLAGQLKEKLDDLKTSIAGDDSPPAAEE